MKRLHVSVSVDSIDASVDFYSTLFGAAPSVIKSDYAKWMLDDPRVNFVIEKRGEARGVDHFGIQVDTPEELVAVTERLAVAQNPLLEQAATTCCYAKSDKTWSADPQGFAWEKFYTFGESPTYGDSARDTGLAELEKGAAACCA